MYVCTYKGTSTSERSTVPMYLEGITGRLTTLLCLGLTGFLESRNVNAKN